ncbi:hypothetical protein [Sabulicella glaciei]|uniref:Uncharacterized protein n=1 Tax=Sabulicella glaciei TaxID=2984948 RepID=A0ABT3NQW6_9PROT|nr:hypothetical protein [Roseococcus sp. MDT2-1-1]MCW8084553.1 hypothetical protein [Roseococcus sp. MDT2-1-1]
MRTPPAPPPPPELSGGPSALPAPEVARLAARDFDAQGAGLEGRPAATALAVARLEFLSRALSPGGAMAGFPDSFRFVMNRAVEEGRQALGIEPRAAPDAVIDALVEASRALAAGREPSLGPPVFRNAQPTPRERLQVPGPLPNAALATAALAEEVARRNSGAANTAFGVSPSP